MPKTHHFFAFRHCARSTRETLDLGLGDDYATERSNYTSQRPDYGVADMQCTKTGIELVKSTGKWLLQSGTIQPGAHIQWEIIADDSQRDIDSAKAMWEGLQEEMRNLRRHEHFRSSFSGEKIRVDERFSDPGDFCDLDSIPHSVWRREIRDRLAREPRPDVSFREALDLLQAVAGKGDVGDLQSYIPHRNVFYDEDTELIPGAPTLLTHLGADMFLSRAGAADPVFAPGTPQWVVFQLYQFHSWQRSVTEVGNSWSAARGAAQVQAMVKTLRDGFFMHQPGDDTYDTRVTMVFGHDGDLDSMATALGAKWILNPPYVSGPGGSFLETPPTSGIYAKRSLDTDRVDLSFVYPNYSADPSSTFFRLNSSGILELTPLRLMKDLEGIFRTGTKSLFLEKSANRKEPSSLDLLEEFVGQAMSEYYPTACYENSSIYWDEHQQTLDARENPIESLLSLRYMLLSAFFTMLSLYFLYFLCKLVVRKNKSKICYQGAWTKESQDTTFDVDDWDEDCVENREII